MQELDDMKSKYNNLELVLGESGNAKDQLKEFHYKIGFISKENENLNRLVLEKNREIEDWKMRNSRLETVIKDRDILETEIRKLKVFNNLILL